MNKILILANDNATIYNFRRELINKLISEKYEVVVCVPDHERNIVFENMGCIVEKITLSRSGTNPFKELGLLLSYVNIIKRIKPGVVLTYTAKPNIYGSLACGILKVPYINNITGFGRAFQKDSFVKKVMLFLQRQAYKKSNKVFFQNYANKEYFESNGIVKNNASLLPGSGVNLDINNYEPFPSEDGVLKFILVSRVRKDKGFDELFEAIKIISDYNTNKVEFHIVGWYEDENYKTKIKEMVNKYPVIYHGTQSQEKVHELISNCHCLLHPSYHEGMANVLLEAAATGRPCLASNIPGCKEAINNEHTGYLFEVRSCESLLNAISKFIDLSHEEKENMGIEGRKKMEEEFNREIVVNAYIKEIQFILTGERKI